MRTTFHRPVLSAEGATRAETVLAPHGCAKPITLTCRRIWAGTHIAGGRRTSFGDIEQQIDIRRVQALDIVGSSSVHQFRQDGRRLHVRVGLQGKGATYRKVGRKSKSEYRS